MKHIRLSAFLLILALFGCNNSGGGSSSEIPAVAPSEDIHNYQFWTDSNIAASIPIYETATTESKAELDRIMAIESKTYMNFIRPYMDITARLNNLATSYEYLGDNKPSNAVDAFIAKKLELSADYNNYKLKYDDGIKAAAAEILKNESAALNNEQKRALTQMGALQNTNLPKEQQARLKAIEARLSALSVNFNKNLVEGAKSLSITITDESLLGQMPEYMKRSFVYEPKEGLRQLLVAKGWVFSPYGAELDTFLKYVTDRDLRAQMYEKSTRAAVDNKPIITEMLQLRHELANINGFSNYADYRIQTQMSAENKETVEALLEKMATTTSGWLPVTQVQNLAMKRDGVEKLQPYDTAYYYNLYFSSLNEEVDPNEELFQSYFEKWTTVRNILSLFEKFYNLNIVEQNIALWNKTARKYSVSKKDGSFVGTLFIDFDKGSAPGKLENAAYASDLMRRSLDKFNRQMKPVVGVLLGFSPDETDKTIKLTYYEMFGTFMHELGHTFHVLLTESEEYDMSGFYSIEWDNAEFPSSFHEFIPLVSTKVVQDISKNIDDGTQIDEKFVKEYLASRKMGMVFQAFNTSVLALMDLAIYSSSTPLTYEQATTTGEAIFNQYLPSAGKTYSLETFSHIFSGGYTAGYYTYIWGQAYAGESLEYMKDETAPLGLNEAKLADFYEKFLKPLSKKGMNQAYKDFRGAETAMDGEALLRLINPNVVSATNSNVLN